MSRIMSDVEGVRNLVGTGLVDFAGGLLTAVDCVRGADAHQRGDDDDRVRLPAGVSDGTAKAFKTIRPIFRERAKINAEVTGRLTEIAGRRAGSEGVSRRRARACGVCVVA